MEIPRTADHPPTEFHGLRGTFCTKRGCRKKTREGKPFCIEDLEHMPYVKGIFDTLEEMKVEQDDAGLGKEVDVTGKTAREILLHLILHGSRTEERLTHEMQIDRKAIINFVRALKEAGLVSTGRTTRGSIVIQLLQQEPERPKTKKKTRKREKSTKKKKGKRKKKSPKRRKAS